MNFIKFLGTAGARIVVSRQLRASGGIWFSLDGTNLLVDPGPGSLVKCFSSRPKLDPLDLDGILITHKHLDHAADVNVMIEAMSAGGLKRQGVVFAPRDALNNDPVILKYVRKYPQKIEVLKAGGKYRLKNLSLNTPVKLDHRVETYGFNLRTKKHTISLIADTRYFKKLPQYFKGDILILYILRPDVNPLDHLTVFDAKEIIKQVKPKITIMTHLGRLMLAAKPWKIAEDMSRELKTKVIAASDGMRLELD